MPDWTRQAGRGLPLMCGLRHVGFGGQAESVSIGDTLDSKCLEASGMQRAHGRGSRRRELGSLKLLAEDQVESFSMNRTMAVGVFELDCVQWKCTAWQAPASHTDCRVQESC